MVKIHYLARLCLAYAFLASGCAQNPTVNPADETIKTHQVSQNSDLAEPKQQTSPSTPTSKKPSDTRKTQTITKKSQQKKPVTASSKPTANTARSNHPSIPLNSPFNLKYGQKRSLPNSDLDFKISKVNDSRCPLEMQCIQQGNAVVTLTLYRNDKRIDIVNVSGDGDMPLIKDRQYAYRFQLLELQPYPTVHFIELQHYVAELIITKISLK